MNYRHAFHAGNFADVVKHVVLVAVLLHLKKKDKPFRVIDTHAGRGLYDLASEEAVRTGEATRGIARLDDLAPVADLPTALDAYLELVRAWRPMRYPGSPLIAASLLRTGDRLIAIERHADEARALTAVLARFPQARVVCADGYARLPALLPPPERRGLVLLDPPFEADDEFARAAASLVAAQRRFATGIFVAWFPVKSRAAMDSFCGEVLSGGIKPALRIVVDVGTGKKNAAGREGLTAAGLLVVNPPFGLAEEMRAIAPIIAPCLGASTELSATITVREIEAGAL